eukprot:scaffold1849_cov239-Pinguiococcus_pyrenoidosus.AAC.8
MQPETGNEHLPLRLVALALVDVDASRDAWGRQRRRDRVAVRRHVRAGLAQLAQYSSGMRHRPAGREASARLGVHQHVGLAGFDMRFGHLFHVVVVALQPSGTAGVVAEGDVVAGVRGSLMHDDGAAVVRGGEAGLVRALSVLLPILGEVQAAQGKLHVLLILAEGVAQHQHLRQVGQAQALHGVSLDRPDALAAGHLLGFRGLVREEGDRRAAAEFLPILFGAVLADHLVVVLEGLFLEEEVQVVLQPIRLRRFGSKAVPQRRDPPHAFLVVRRRPDIFIRRRGRRRGAVETGVLGHREGDVKAAVQLVRLMPAVEAGDGAHHRQAKALGDDRLGVVLWRRRSAGDVHCRLAPVGRRQAERLGEEVNAGLGLVVDEAENQAHRFMCVFLLRGGTRR